MDIQQHLQNKWPRTSLKYLLTSDNLYSTSINTLKYKIIAKVTRYPLQIKHFMKMCKIIRKRTMWYKEQQTKDQGFSCIYNILCGCIKSLASVIYSLSINLTHFILYNNKKLLVRK